MLGIAGLIGCGSGGRQPGNGTPMYSIHWTFTNHSSDSTISLDGEDNGATKNVFTADVRPAPNGGTATDITTNDFSVNTTTIFGFLKDSTGNIVRTVRLDGESIAVDSTSQAGAIWDGITLTIAGHTHENLCDSGEEANRERYCGYSAVSGIVRRYVAGNCCASRMRRNVQPCRY